MNRNSLALHTALESPNPSSPRTRSLSMRLITRYPRREQIPGIQSTNDTCTGGSWSGCPHGECACADKIAASKKVQFANANLVSVQFLVFNETSLTTYQSACKIHPNCSTMLSQRDFGERVQTHTARVIVRSRDGHVVKI